MSTDSAKHSIADPEPALEHVSSRLVRHQFMAWFAPGIFEHKAYNFIIDQQAELISHDEDRIHLRLGRKSLAPWAKDRPDFPLDVHITRRFDTKCAKDMTHVVADLHAQVSVSQEALDARCAEVVRALHCCFLGHHLEVVEDGQL